MKNIDHANILVQFNNFIKSFRRKQCHYVTKDYGDDEVIMKEMNRKIQSEFVSEGPGKAYNALEGFYNKIQPSFLKGDALI